MIRITITDTRLYADNPVAEFEPGAKPVQRHIEMNELDEREIYFALYGVETGNNLAIAQRIANGEIFVEFPNGVIEVKSDVACSECEGTGRVRVRYGGVRGYNEAWVRCSQCGGRG